MAKEKIGIALSGGVDSAVSALLLQRSGYEVEAWHMRLPQFCAGHFTCTEGEDLDARRSADFLGIPLHTIDLNEPFMREVIAPFTAAYARGDTPNPCTYCNPAIKFGVLREAMRQAGTPLMATGHYALIEPEPTSEHTTLRIAPDATKDQTYFLYALTPEILKTTRFPIGHLLRPQVRAIAEEAGIPVSQKKSSQDICFLPEGDYRPLVLQQHPETKAAGQIISADGTPLGTHQGLCNYTIGQRRGLGIATGERVFVTRLDADRNEVVLGPREDLLCQTFTVSQTNWLIPFEGACECHVVTRYHHAPVPCIVETTPELLATRMCRVRLLEPQTLITPGQAAVFYRGEYVLGGGLIAQRG